jgi:uncharacterized protein (TIGR00369 family)
MLFPGVVPREACNGHDTLHGGFAAWMADTYTAMHAGAVTGHLLVSLDLKVSFLVGVPLGQRVWVRTAVVKAGRSVVFAEAAIVDAVDNRIVYVTATHCMAVAVKDGVALARSAL